MATKITPWYKEPWAWLVFFLPFSAIVAGISTLIIANTDADTLVVGDYYKKGKAINLELKKIKQAQKLGMRFQIQVVDNKLTLRPTGIEKEFSVLNINFYHPTLESKDFSLSLTANGNGNFTHYFDDDNNISGKWHIAISSYTNTWRIESIIFLPQQEFVDIAPRFIKSK